MKTPSGLCWGVFLAFIVCGTQAAEIELEGNRLLVIGVLDGSAFKTFNEHLASGKVSTVVFENSFGGTAEAAGDYASAIRASGVKTEMKGQCHAACAYAFLAGKEHRFARGLQVNGLLIPVAARPRPEELATRWRGEESHRTLAEFTPGAGATVNAPPVAPSGTPAQANPAPAERWQPGHGVLFTSTPTLFGKVYNSYYCDGTQGRDMTRCESLSDADPFKLGVLTP